MPERHSHHQTGDDPFVQALSKDKKLPQPLEELKSKVVWYRDENLVPLF